LPPRPVVACEPNEFSNALVDFVHRPEWRRRRVALGLFQRQQADPKDRIEDRRVTFSDPENITDDAILAVAVPSDAIGGLKDCLLIIDLQSVWRAAFAPAPLLVACLEAAGP
jgi:hypothetical protein